MLTIALLALTACSVEPSAKKADGSAATKEAPSPTQVPAPPPSGSPAAAEGAAGSGATPTSTPQIEITPGTGVKLSGVVKYAGTAKGTIRMDVSAPEEGKPDSSRIVFAALLDKVGPFEVEVPKDVGPVTLTAFIDANGDGPSAGEPIAVLAGQTLGSAPLTGLTFELEDSLGGQAPPANPAQPAGNPPAGAPPAAPAPG